MSVPIPGRCSHAWQEDNNFRFQDAGRSFGPNQKLTGMYTGLLHLHSFLRWVILILALIAIFRSYRGMTAGRPFTEGDKKTGLFLMIAAQIGADHPAARHFGDNFPRA